MGELPPHRGSVSDRQEWIDSARLPKSVFQRHWGPEADRAPGRFRMPQSQPGDCAGLLPDLGAKSPLRVKDDNRCVDFAASGIFRRERMCVRIDGNMASATERDVVRVAAKRSNLVRTLFVVLFAGWLGQPALAQTLPNPTGLTEADIAPCNELLSYRGALFSHPTDLSNLDFALSTYPYKPLYDIEATRTGLEHSADSVEIMEARDEERMASVIGRVYTGQDYTDRLNSDRRFSCMLNVRLGQLTGKKPSTPTAKPVGPSAAVPAAGAAASGQDDVWSKCIKVEQYPEDGGIQTIWAMRNQCNTTLIARFCFQARVEAAGDPNLCRRRESRTQEISAGGKYDFPFSLVQEGTSLSDGRVAGRNSLSVVGYACTDGRFPDSYFDNDGAFRSRECR